VWSEGIILLAPPFYEHLRLFEGVEDLPIEQFISEFAVEAFAVAVFPRASWFDVQSSYSCSFKPFTYSLSGKFRSVIRPDMLRWTVGHEEIREAIQYVIRIEPSFHYDVQALSAEFVDDRQHLDAAAIMRAVFDKIIGPDMVTMGRPEPDTRSIVEPQTSSFGLLLRNLQPLLTPDTFHPLMVNLPTLSLEQCRNPAITVTPIGFGKLNNFFPESFFCLCPSGYQPLSRSRLAH